MGVAGDKNWCFLMMLRALLIEYVENRQYIQVQNNNTSWKT